MGKTKQVAYALNMQGLSIYRRYPVSKFYDLTSAFFFYNNSSSKLITFQNPIILLFNYGLDAAPQDIFLGIKSPTSNDFNLLFTFDLLLRSDEETTTIHFLNKVL
jgi:hypothetical protein